MKILLLGANGQLGRELCSPELQWDAEVTTPERKDVDISALAQIQSVAASQNFDCIINAAAYTSVDEAENHLHIADLVNRVGSANVAQVADEMNIPLVHLSTDYVFDGTNNHPYTTEEKVNPINVYGKTKEAGESEIRRLHEEHIIIRTSWIYGVHRSNFVKTILRLGEEKSELKVVNDQFGSPTSATDLAQAISKIVCKIISEGNTTNWGTYHYCGEGNTNWCEFAKYIFEAWQFEIGHTPKVTCIPSRDFKQAAPRPSNTVLDCTKILDEFDLRQTPWRVDVKRVLERLSQNRILGETT